MLDVISQISEGYFAVIVRVFVMLLIVAIPGMKQLWEDDWKWKNLVLLGISVVLVPMGFWLLECVGSVDIPGFVPRCTFEGVVMDALYPGLLAFLFNYVGEDALTWARSRKNNLLSVALRWAGNLFFWGFVITVVAEAVLLLMGVPWELGLATGFL